MEKRDTSQKTGIALGSGAARGMAHIGVLRALEDAGRKPGCVAGTSIGALVGGVYAAGKLDELTDIVLALDWKQAASFFLEASFPRSGLIEGNKVTEFLAKILGRRKIRDLPIPFRAVATEITSGREVVIDDGDLVDAIRASISVPGVFSPAERGGGLLVDGGLVDPVPVCVCRVMGAERVIAVDLNLGRVRDTRPSTGANAGANGKKIAKLAGIDANELFEWVERSTKRLSVGLPDPVKAWMERRSAPSIFDVLGNSLRIMEAQISATRLEIDRPDLLIRPEVGDIGFMEFFRAEEMIAEGYRAAKDAFEREGRP